MPHEDNYAFDAMNAADPDIDVTGGAIKYSSYEMDMSPEEQGKYKKTLLGSLASAYRSDPNKGRLSFTNWWLKELENGKKYVKIIKMSLIIKRRWTL